MTALASARATLRIAIKRSVARRIRLVITDHPIQSRDWNPASINPIQSSQSESEWRTPSIPATSP
jgi:hypothetical protein